MIADKTPVLSLAERRDQIAQAAGILIVPLVVNAMLRIGGFFLLRCTEADFDNLGPCLPWAVQAIFLSIPKLLAIVFLSLKGWKLLWGQAHYGEST